MTDTVLGAAVTRLERAIARLEQTRLLPPRAADDGGLRARHDALRARVGETIARLDALIAAHEDDA